MKDEIARIIAMLQEGKINAEEAEQLISAMKADEQEPRAKKGYLGKMLKVRITSEAKDNVVVNIPVKIVKFALKLGHGIAWSIPEAKGYVEDIDIDLLMNAIDNEIEGKIVDIQTEDGDTVIIAIE